MTAHLVPLLAQTQQVASLVSEEPVRDAQSEQWAQPKQRPWDVRVIRLYRLGKMPVLQDLGAVETVGPLCEGAQERRRSRNRRAAKAE